MSFSAGSRGVVEHLDDSGRRKEHIIGPRMGSRQPTCQLGSMGYERQLNAEAERLVWLETAVVREPSESYSDVILRLIELESSMKARR